MPDTPTNSAADGNNNQKQQHVVVNLAGQLESLVLTEQPGLGPDVKDETAGLSQDNKKRSKPLVRSGAVPESTSPPKDREPLLSEAAKSPANTSSDDGSFPNLSRDPSSEIPLESGAANPSLTKDMKAFVDELLKSSFKDRQSLYRVEQQLINYLNSGQTELCPVTQLENAYQRLLAHKMAVFFRLDHVNNKNQVLMIRRADSQLPGVNFREVVEAELLNQPRKSILKRNCSSEDSPLAGSFEKDKSPDSHLNSCSDSSLSKSLEEREVNYQKVRARIFCHQNSSTNASSEAEAGTGSGGPPDLEIMMSSPPNDSQQQTVPCDSGTQKSGDENVEETSKTSKNNGLNGLTVASQMHKINPNEKTVISINDAVTKPVNQGSTRSAILNGPPPPPVGPVLPLPTPTISLSAAAAAAAVTAGIQRQNNRFRGSNGRGGVRTTGINHGTQNNRWQSSNMSRVGCFPRRQQNQRPNRFSRQNQPQSQNHPYPQGGASSVPPAGPLLRGHQAQQNQQNFYFIRFSDFFNCGDLSPGHQQQIPVYSTAVPYGGIGMDPNSPGFQSQYHNPHHQNHPGGGSYLTMPVRCNDPRQGSYGNVAPAVPPNYWSRFSGPPYQVAVPSVPSWPSGSVPYPVVNPTGIPYYTSIGVPPASGVFASVQTQQYVAGQNLPYEPPAAAPPPLMENAVPIYNIVPVAPDYGPNPANGTFYSIPVPGMQQPAIDHSAAQSAQDGPEPPMPHQQRQ